MQGLKDELSVMKEVLAGADEATRDRLFARRSREEVAKVNASKMRTMQNALVQTEARRNL